MGDLALALVQILHLQAQQIAGGGKGEPCAGGIIPKQADAQTGIEYLGGYVLLTQAAQRVRHGKHSLQLIAALFPCQEKIALVHIGKIQLCQLVGIMLYLTHYRSPSKLNVVIP